MNVAAMTYDDVPALAEFGEDRQIAYPLLSDKGAKHVDALGIRNERYEPGHAAYGIGHPGVFFVAADGIVRAKLAEADYRERPAFEDLLTTAKSLAKRTDAAP